MKKERGRKQRTEPVKVFLNQSLEEVKNDTPNSYPEYLGAKKDFCKKAFQVGVQRSITHERKVILAKRTPCFLASGFSQCRVPNSELPDEMSGIVD